MGLLDKFRGREVRATGDDPSWQAMIGGGTTLAGAHVDAKSAESISAVYACVTALAESTACLPLHVHRRTESGDRERADGHWLSKLLERPNDWQTGLEFRESQTAAVLLWGNAYARKEFNGAGEVTALHPLAPQRVAIVKLPNGRHRYEFTEDSGQVVRLLPDEVLHLRDRTEPGSLLGKSRIAIARETLGLSLALRTHGANVFGRGARPAAVVSNEGPRDPSPEQMRALHDRLAEHSHPRNAGKTLIMPKGLKWQTIGLSNEDAEWLTAMQFGVSEVCRIFRVPPILVQDLSHATYSNVQELGQQFVRFSLQRWLSAWEAALSHQLLGPIARQRYWAEHSLEGLLRAQPKERAEFYGAAIKDGWMTQAEVRKLENLPALPVDAQPAR